MTNEQAQKVADALATLKPGFLPFAIFHQVVRLTATPIIEVVPLKKTADGQVKVLLLQREADDPIWPNALHTPGTVIRGTDATFEGALARVFHNELAGVQLGAPVFVTHLLHHSGRGNEAAFVYWAEVTDEPPVGAFYNTNQLPQALAQSQLDFLPQAFAHFRQHTR